MKKTYQKPAIKIRELSYETAVLQSSGDIPQLSDNPADNSQNLSKCRVSIWDDDYRGGSFWDDDYDD